MPKKRFLGCSFPVLVGIIILFIALLAIGFLAGPLGPKMIGAVGRLINENYVVPGWIQALSVLGPVKPEPRLPAETVFHIGSFPIANSVIAAWLSIIVLAGLSYAATRRMKLVPRGVQNLLEFALEALLSFCHSVAGEKNGRKFFPIVATIFLFVIFNAWLSLLPGFGTILIANHEGHAIHLIRGANTDINMPLAIALASFITVEIFGIRTLGVRYLRKFLNLGQFARSLRQIFTGKIKSGLSGLLFGGIDIFVGILETLSELIRLVSFTFRLFGNMTAGEILLLIVGFLMPYVVSVLFFGLELLIGFVQALVFAGLTLVFLTMAVAQHGEESEHDKEKPSTVST